jgi:hypothetical protein
LKKIDGAPWPMKMGNTRSPWRYDAVALVAIQSVNLRWAAISRYGLADGSLPNFEARSGAFEARSTPGLPLTYAI